MPEALYWSYFSRDVSLLLSSPKSPKWRNIDPYFEKIEIRDEEQLINSYDKFGSWIVLGNAVLSKGLVPQNYFMKFFITGLYGSLYFFHSKSRHEQYKHFVSNPDLKIAQFLWNSVDIKVFSSVYNVKVPRVKMNQILYIPKTDPNFISNHPFLDKILEKFENNEELKEPNLIDEERHFNAFGEVSQDTNYHTNSKEFNESTHVQVRLLYNNKFPHNFATGHNNETESQVKNNRSNEVNSSLFSCFSLYHNPGVKDVDTIIIHIHGGGFISMSSNSHQIYTRVWARDTNLAIFSIDYRLAPQYPYPCPLED